MELQCPKCSSSELRSCALVWREGTTDARGSIVGGSFAGAGFQPAAASTCQHSQTLLAQQCAPPKEHSTWGAVWALLFLVWGLFLPTTAPSLWVIGVPMVLFGLYCAWAAYQAWQYNHSALAEDLRKWEQTYVCARCGELVTAADAPVAPA